MDSSSNQTPEIIQTTTIAAQKVLRQPMTRQEFLRYVGATFLALVGIQQLLNVLLHLDRKPKVSSQAQSLSYGGSAYGGASKN